MSIALSLGESIPHFAPMTQLVLLALSTFIQEDVPAIGAALLAVSGRMTLGVAYLGCFFGIWVGDLLLYLLARVMGREALHKSWVRRFVTPAALDRSEKWFAGKGVWLLPLSRMIPGLRLPTYLAAGLLRFPFARFFWVTGFCVAVWTAAIFGLAVFIGEYLLLRWLHSLAWLAASVAALFCAYRFCLARLKGLRLGSLVGKWARWEFWPPWLFYPPVAAYYLLLCVRYRSLTLPTAANPGIFAGGIVGESKMEILGPLQRAAPEFTAASWLIPRGSSAARLQLVKDLFESECLAFPVILKPDAGQRGAGVKLIRSFNQAELYLSTVSVPLVLQCYAPGPFEAGVFYVRFPQTSKGKILGITEKLFPSIVGDGLRTVSELIRLDARASFLSKTYLTRFSSIENKILDAGESLKLVEAGNHAQGCVFKDGMHLWTPTLESAFDAISQTVPGFYIGRFDVRFSDPQDFMKGVGFQIVELNGAAAEMTSIYDPKTSLFTAYEVLFHQWRLVMEIGATNRRAGHAPMSPKELWSAWRKFQKEARTLPGSD